MNAAPNPATGQVLAAFLAIYFIWGSTYLAIRIANESLPPFLMASARFMISGSVLYVWCRWRAGPAFVRPTLVHWRSTCIVGGLLLLGGNGGVVWAESGDRVPSGLAAVMVATLPIWMVLMEWLRPGGTRPTVSVAIGVLLGFAGLFILVDPMSALQDRSVDLVGAIVLVCASMSWAAGSIYSRHTVMPASPILSTAMQMLCGSVLQLIFGTIIGDWGRLDLASVSSRSLLAVVYLIVLGSLIGYTAYIWLLRVTTPARVSTYAYVNPVVAVALGWALYDEKLDTRTLVAAGIIIAGVAFITIGRSVAPPAAVKPAAGAEKPEEPRPREAVASVARDGE